MANEFKVKNGVKFQDNTVQTTAAPSLTGVGATGTWGINVTGNAATATTATQVVRTVTGTTSAELVRGNMGDNDQARILVGATASNAGFLEIATADDGTEPIHVRQYTGVFTTLTRTATLLDGSGNTSFPGTVTAPTFSGALSGNASTATTLQTTRAINGTNFNGSADITTANWGTARTITIGSTGKSVNGSANVAWTLAEIGAQAAGNYVTTDTTQTISGAKTFTAAITHNGTSTRDKYRVWSDSNYIIGMQNSITFGAINNDYAMTFQMNNADARGFWWGDASHTTAQGAMALSTNGKLSVAHSARIGFGETDTTVPGAVHRLEVNGSFAATSKSFLIDHPTKPNKKLQYGSLEGPEFGVYVRGRLTGDNIIALPDYWTGLVDPDTITVSLTPIGKHQNLFVEDIDNNQVVVGNSNLFGKEVNCFYVVYAERKDINKLQVEIG